MKIISAKMAAELIQDNWIVTTGGFGSCGHPERFSTALKQRYKNTNSPKNLTLVFAAGQGDRKKRGLNKLAQEGLLKRVIGGYWSLAPKLGQLAFDEKIEAYNWPQGVISHLFRSIAAGIPGVFTKVGLNTFIDPRNTGGRLNKKTSEELVSIIKIKNSEYLHYPTFPINCSIIRATNCDTNGNLSFTEEANLPEVLAQAQAAHNSGGIVIAQVKEIIPLGSASLHEVRVPGMLVDYVFKSKIKDHWQTYGHPMNPSFIGKHSDVAIKKEPSSQILDTKTVIARRAYMELFNLNNPIVNLGIGIPERIAEVAASADHPPPYVLTVESGAVGGTPAGGLSFGASDRPEALMDQPALFDFYDGGGVDIAFLGFGEVGSNGDVNVGLLNNKINGVGGFINISQSASKVIFCGLFLAGKQSIAIQNKKLRIIQEGNISKFVNSVGQINFHAYGALDRGVEIKYITERAVFELHEDGVHIVEIAPGIDLEKDILSHCKGHIKVADNLCLMNLNIFKKNNWSRKIDKV